MLASSMQSYFILVDAISFQCFGAYAHLVGSRRQCMLLAGRLRKHFHLHVHAWKLSFQAHR